MKSPHLPLFTLIGLLVFVGILSASNRTHTPYLYSELLEAIEQPTSNTALEAAFPEYRSMQSLELNKLDNGNTELVNPFFDYKVTFPQNKYNINVDSWAEVAIMDPSNTKTYMRITADKTGVEPVRDGSNTKVNLKAGTATKYHYDYDDYYTLSNNDNGYTIRVNNEEAFAAETLDLLNGIEFVTIHY